MAHPSSAGAPLVLVTAGGLAREVAAAAEAAGLDVTGFVDDDPALWGQMRAGRPVLGPLEQVKELTDAQLVLCAGSGAARQSLLHRLRGLGVSDGRFATVRHPTVEVPPGCSVGSGSVLLAQTVLTADVRLGPHTVVMPGAVLTHDDRLGDFVTVCAGVALGGSVEVATRAYLGMNASVRQGVRVGADSVLGMGSVLLTDLPDGQTWAGVPARRLTGRQP